MNYVCSYCHTKNCLVNQIYQIFHERSTDHAKQFLLTYIKNVYVDYLYEEIDINPQMFNQLFVEFYLFDTFTLEHILQNDPRYYEHLNKYFLTLSERNLREFHEFHYTFDIYNKFIGIYKEKTEKLFDIVRKI